MNNVLLVYTHSGKIVRLDFASETQADAALSKFAGEGQGVQIDDDYGSYTFRFDNIAFVKKIQEGEM